MAGHNKWSKIKRQKAAADQKKGQIFGKFSKNISLAAKEGGGDPETNYKLQLLIDRAKDAGMPNDNIERAIKRGTGEGQIGELTAATYEGIGPAGSAFIVETATDNTNRTVQEIKQIFSENGAQLADSGSAAWMFDHRGLILATTDKPEEITLAAIDAGALDVEEHEALRQDSGLKGVEIQTNPKDLMKVKDAITGEGVKIETAELAWIPKQPINPEDKEKIQQLMDVLDENDDVVDVYNNLV